MTDHPLCERTIRACIEAVKYSPVIVDDRNRGMKRACLEALEALLPKPDPVKDATDEDRRCGNCRWYTNTGSIGPCKRYAPRDGRPEHPEYAKWPWVQYGDLCGDWQP